MRVKPGESIETQQGLLQESGVVIGPGTLCCSHCSLVRLSRSLLPSWFRWPGQERMGDGEAQEMLVYSQVGHELS